MQLRSTTSDSGPRNSSLSRPADSKRIGSRETTSRGITRHMDIWQTNTNASQEELTLGEWYQDQQEWHHMRDNERRSDSEAFNTKPKNFVKKQIEVQDRERPIE